MIHPYLVGTKGENPKLIKVETEKLNKIQRLFFHENKNPKIDNLGHPKAQPKSLRSPKTRNKVTEREFWIEIQ